MSIHTTRKIIVITTLKTLGERMKRVMAAVFARPPITPVLPDLFIICYACFAFLTIIIVLRDLLKYVMLALLFE